MSGFCWSFQYNSRFFLSVPITQVLVIDHISMFRQWLFRFLMPKRSLRSWALRKLHEHGTGSCQAFCQMTATLTKVTPTPKGDLVLYVTNVEGASKLLDGETPSTLHVPHNLLHLDRFRPQLLPHKRIVAEVNPKTWVVNRFVAIEWRLYELKGHLLSWCQRTDSIELYVHTPNDPDHDPLDPFVVPDTLQAYKRFQAFLEHCVSPESQRYGAQTEIDLMVRKGSNLVQAVRYRQLDAMERQVDHAQRREDAFQNVTFSPPRVKWHQAGTTLMPLPSSPSEARGRFATVTPSTTSSATSNTSSSPNHD